MLHMMGERGLVGWGVGRYWDGIDRMPRAKGCFNCAGIGEAIEFDDVVRKCFLRKVSCDMVVSFPCPCEFNAQKMGNFAHNVDIGERFKFMFK